MKRSKTTRALRNLIRVIRVYSRLSLCFFLLSVSAFSQTPTVKLRLYSLHHEAHLKITAKTGKLAFKTCGNCLADDVAGLEITSTIHGLRIAGRAHLEDQAFVEGNYLLEPEEGFSLSLNFPLEITTDHGELKILLDVPLEDYVATALAGESGSFKNEESMKAMAVAVRSYAALFKSRHGAAGYDFCDTTHCQTLNFKGISAQVRAAVEATRGEMLWYQGKPAATFYHQNCGGTLAAAAEAWPTMAETYLHQQADPYCVRGPLLPWRAELDRRQLQDALRKQGLTVPEGWSSLEIVSRMPSGRVRKLAFQHPGGTPQLVSGSSLRFAIGRSFGWNQVRSDLYEVQTTADAVIFTGRGAGHGVGLCQAGAEQMAKEGQGYRKILAFYYPGATLGLTAARSLNWEKRASGRFELLSTQLDQDAEALPAAETVLANLESELGWKLEFNPQLKMFPTLDAYRNSTGQPGWIAAFTRGRIISLQPLAVLKEKSILESTLRHEFAHLLIEARAHAGTPLWFREGLTLYFADPRKNIEPVQMTEAEMEKTFQNPGDRKSLEHAYAAARTKVERMVRENGKETVLQWLNSGKHF